MKKWKKMLMAMFVTVVIIATTGIFNLGTVNATEIHRSMGVTGNPANNNLARAWGNVVGQNGANFRVRHYRRYVGGSTSFINMSGWGVSGATVNTQWGQASVGNSLAILVDVSTW